MNETDFKNTLESIYSHGFLAGNAWCARRAKAEAYHRRNFELDRDEVVARFFQVEKPVNQTLLNLRLARKDILDGRPVSTVIAGTALLKIDEAIAQEEAK